MKRVLRVFDVIFKSIALMVVLLGISVVIVALAPRKVEKATLNDIPRIAEYFNVDKAELVSSPSGDMRFIIEMENIDKEYLVARCMTLKESSPYERMAFLFYNEEYSLSIIVDNDGRAYAEDIKIDI